MPVREQREAEGHVVRALYLYIAMADVGRLTGDTSLLETCRILFDDIVRRKLYITGGAGSGWYGERFTIPYDLPNAEAFAETCALMSLRLLHLCEFAGTMRCPLYVQLSRARIGMNGCESV